MCLTTVADALAVSFTVLAAELAALAVLFAIEPAASVDDEKMRFKALKTPIVLNV